MVKNVNAQEWLNEKYPIKGVCKRDNDQENKGKRRDQITELDIRKGNLGKSFWGGEVDKVLVGSLKLEGFTNLQTLIISSHQITDLDVSGCNSLVELDCQNSQINTLNVTDCSNLKKINCSDNNIRELDLSTCPNLE